MSPGKTSSPREGTGCPGTRLRVEVGTKDPGREDSLYSEPTWDPTRARRVCWRPLHLTYSGPRGAGPSDPYRGRRCSTNATLISQRSTRRGGRDRCPGVYGGPMKLLRRRNSGTSVSDPAAPVLSPFGPGGPDTSVLPKNRPRLPRVGTSGTEFEDWGSPHPYLRTPESRGHTPPNNVVDVL